MRIVLASDHAGFLLKELLRKHLQKKGFQVEDCGAFDDKEAVDYPDFALKAARAVQEGRFDCGIIVCGTGIGTAIAANKLKGIRAALCHDTFSAACARAHNDANILALGARVIGEGLAREVVEVFLTVPFEGGRHSKRLEKIKKMEEERNGTKISP